MRINANRTYSKETTLEMYGRARSNLLLMIIFTVVNIGLYMGGSGTVMLFSATVPYVAAVMCDFFVGTPIHTILMGIAAGTILSYFLSWLFSKKHAAWMTVALVLFILDTGVLLGLALIMKEASSILDIVIHIWVLYYLIMGVRDGIRLRKLDQEETFIPADSASENGETQTGEPLYLADTTVKARVLLEANEMGHHICYRRVKRTNELVIDGYVYDALDMLIEPPHTLSVKLGDHFFQVGHDGLHSYMRIDGKLIMRKLRIW